MAPTRTVTFSEYEVQHTVKGEWKVSSTTNAEQEAYQKAAEKLDTFRDVRVVRISMVREQVTIDQWKDGETT
jgi:hypothetical protein